MGNHTPQTNSEPEFFEAGAGLVTGTQMQAYKGYGRDGNQDDCEHDDDEPCGAIGCFGAGLGDAHGVDEEVGDELDGLHGF